MAAKRRKFSTTMLEQLKPAKEGARDTYHDTVMPYLVLRVTDRGTKTFQVYRKIHGKPKRVTIGCFPRVELDDARKQAIEINTKLESGEDPTAEKRRERKSYALTLSEALDMYLEAKAGKLREGTVNNYRSSLYGVFGDYKNRPLSDITKDVVRTVNNEYGKRSPSRTANAMRVLRAVFNHAHHTYETDGDSPFRANPVTILTKTGTWHRVKRRKTYINATQMPPWFKAVLALPDKIRGGEAFRDYFLFLLFTGARLTEGQALEWRDIDLRGKTFTLRDTKNDETVTLPLCPYLVDMLKSRRRTLKAQEDALVFPVARDVRHAQKRVVEASGITFTPHDLRRTFLTIGEGLDIGSYTLKRLVNHKTAEYDITAGYLGVDQKRLRQATTDISNAILKAAKQKRRGNVVKLEATRG